MLNIFKNKKLILISLLLVFGLMLIFSNIALAQTTSPSPSPSPSPASQEEAGLGTKLLNAAISVMVTIITFVINALSQLAGKLVILLMEVVVWLSMYNRFIDNPYVNEGWVILRDLVNMFFILGLLFIAFVTVLKIEKYQWNKLLARLLIMAILVNFSKTICGLIIDFFQVLMITFVNAYKDITAGNIFKGLAITDWYKININRSGDIAWQAGIASVVASLLALAFTVITLIVMLIFCVILAFRIVALWALVVFSPLAFFAWVFQGQGGPVGSLANKWFSQFFNYCMIGPFLAFFLWLSILTMAKLNLDQMVTADQYDKAKRQQNSATIGEAGTMDNVITIMMGIIMLVAGLKFSQEFAVAGSGMAGRAADKMKNSAQNTLERGARRSARAVTAPARWAGRAAKKPISAVREGAAQKIRQNRVLKVLTKSGREDIGKSVKAAIKRPFVGSAEQIKVDDERADSFKDAKQDINWENAESVDDLNKSLMGGSGNLDKQNRVIDASKASKNREAIYAGYKAKADQGKLTTSDMVNLEKIGFFDGKDKLYKQKFKEDMEDRVEKSTGRKKAFSTLVYNKENNKYEDLSELEAAAKNALSGTSLSLEDLDMESMAERQADGTYKLDQTSDAFQNLSAQQQQDLRVMEANGTNVGSDFYNLARSGNILKAKRREVREGTAGLSNEQANAVAKLADFGDPREEPDFADAEIDGMTYKIASVSGWTDEARKNAKLKEDMRFAKNNDERIQIIENNKEYFDKKYHFDPVKDKTRAKWRARIGGYYAKMDKRRDNMSASDLKRNQKFYKAVSGEYDNDGRVKKEGTKNQDIANMVDNLRRQKGPKTVIQNEVNQTSLSQPNKTAAVDFVDEHAFDMLEATASEPDETVRIGKIATEIRKNTQLSGGDARNVAQILIKKEGEVIDRQEDTADLKKSASVKIRDYADSIKQQFTKGDRNPTRMQFKKNALINYLQDEINQGQLIDKEIAPNFVEQEFDALIQELQTAQDTTAFNKALAQFRKNLKNMGYELSKK
jgi:hypothetical protein